MTDPTMIEHRDVLIVGAGLSGIGAAHHLQAAFPAKTYAILEGRANAVNDVVQAVRNGEGDEFVEVNAEA